MPTTLVQNHFRFGNDDGTEATHTFKAAEDVNVSLFAGVNFLLRFIVQETGATAAANTDLQFRYNKNGAGWVNITTSSAVVRAVAVNAFVNGANCTQRLTGTGTFETTGAGCTEDGLSGGTANDIAASGCSETECGLQIVPGSVVKGDTIQISLSSPDFTITETKIASITVLANVSLALVSGSFAPTGTHIDLKAARKLAVASGAFALSGTHTTLTKAAALNNRTLAVSSGSFSQSGTHITYRATRKISPVSRSFAFTGTNAAVKAARKLPVASGSLVETGGALPLKVTRRLPAASGAISLAGSPVCLHVSPMVMVASGAFGFHGDSVALSVARKLNAEPGAFSEVGSPVSIKASRRISIHQGAISLAGQSLCFPVERAAGAYAISIASGSFALSGQAVGEKVERKINLAPGLFTENGESIAIKASRKIPLALGSFDLSGQPVGLDKGGAFGAIAIGPGSFVFTGKNVKLHYARNGAQIRAGQGERKMFSDPPSRNVSGLAISASVAATGIHRSVTAGELVTGV